MCRKDVVLSKYVEVAYHTYNILKRTERADHIGESSVGEYKAGIREHFQYGIQT